MNELAKEAFVYKCVMFMLTIWIQIYFFLFSYFNYRNNIEYRRIQLCK